MSLWEIERLPYSRKRGNEYANAAAGGPADPCGEKDISAGLQHAFHADGHGSLYHRLYPVGSQENDHAVGLIQLSRGKRDGSAALHLSQDGVRKADALWEDYDQVFPGFRAASDRQSGPADSWRDTWLEGDSFPGGEREKNSGHVYGYRRGIWEGESV